METTTVSGKRLDCCFIFQPWTGQVTGNPRGGTEAESTWTAITSCVSMVCPRGVHFYSEIT